MSFINEINRKMVRNTSATFNFVFFNEIFDNLTYNNEDRFFKKIRTQEEKRWN